MKCIFSKVIYAKKLRKKFLMPEELKDIDVSRTVSIERCTGDILCTVQAEDEPYFGGSSSVLRVVWTCSNPEHKGETVGPFNEHTINDYINEKLLEDEGELIWDPIRVLACSS